MKSYSNKGVFLCVEWVRRGFYNKYQGNTSRAVATYSGDTLHGVGRTACGNWQQGRCVESCQYKTSYFQEKSRLRRAQDSPRHRLSVCVTFSFEQMKIFLSAVCSPPFGVAVVTSCRTRVIH